MVPSAPLALHAIVLLNIFASNAFLHSHHGLLLKCDAEIHFCTVNKIRVAVYFAKENATQSCCSFLLSFAKFIPELSLSFYCVKMVTRMRLLGDCAKRHGCILHNKMLQLGEGPCFLQSKM